MNIINKLKSINKRIFFGIIFLTFFRILFEGISTQFLPTYAITVFDQSTSLGMVLIYLIFILCMVDIIIAPILSFKTSVLITEFLHLFRLNNTKKIVSNSMLKNDKFNDELKLAEDYLDSFLHENINQISYRIVYGIGSLISIFLLSKTFFLIVIFVGIMILIIRKLYEPVLEVARETRYENNMCLIEIFKLLTDNIFYYLNEVTGLNVLKKYGYVNKGNNDAIISHNNIRGSMQMIIFFLTEATLFLLLAYKSLASSGSISELGIIFAIRPAFNFFNYLNVTIDSTKENIHFLNKFMNKSEHEKILHGQSIKPNSYDIEFKDIEFNYGNKKILDRFSIEFKKGSYYEIRGPRGAGKTTILKLIMKQITPLSGKIMIDNIDLKNVDINKICFYLPYDISLFKLSVRDNILLGKEEPPEFNNIIKSLSLDTIISNESDKLSTGEIKRVALARAFFTEHKIVLLDEFNSNLDLDNTRDINSLLKKLNSSGKTIITINHKEPSSNAQIIDLERINVS